MENDTEFSAWAIDRANAVIREEGIELIRSSVGQSDLAVHHCIQQLTIAIIKALVDARNFPLQQGIAAIQRPN